MQRAAYILPILLLFFFTTNAYALQVVVNPSPITATVSKTEPVVSFTASITLEANDDAVVLYVSSSSSPYVGLIGPTYVTTSGTYTYMLVVPPSPGVYTGTLKFLAVGTGASYQVSFNVTVSVWEEKLRDYFEKGIMYQVTLGNNNYLMKIRDVASGTIQLYFDGMTYTLAEGDSQAVLDNLKIEVDSVFTSGAVLRFYTDGTQLTVTPYTSTTTSDAVLTGTEDLSGFHFLISKYSKYIQRDMVYTITVTLVNDTDYRVYLKDVYFENTTVTEEGEKPTRLEDYQLPSYLDPGQELTLKVTIDTRGLDVGKTYTPTLVALGRVGNQDVRAQVDFYITVVEAVQSTSETTQTQPQQPTQPQPQLPTQPTTPQKQLLIEITPPNPQPGDTVTIYVKDQRTGEYINATVMVNGEQTSTFTAEWCKTYRINATAPGYMPATKTVSTKCKTLNVTHTPTTIEEGDEVTFTVLDAESGEPVNAVITIDGKPLAGLTWIATPGTHVVNVKAEGYSPKTLTLKVKEKPVQLLTSIPEEVNAGEEITLELSKEATWEVYDENNVLIASGEGSVISFKAKEPGTYTIKVDGKVLGSFTAISNVQTTGLPISVPRDWLWYAAAAGLGLILYDAFKKRRRKTSKTEYPVGFELRPKPKFALPQGEQGEQQGGGST